MNAVAANTFRQGFSTRTFMGIDMFPYRQDNVQEFIKKIEFKQKAHNVTFNLRFNINKIDFNSKLNEDLKFKMEQVNFSEEWTNILEKDYSVNKRQFVFYVLDCRESSGLLDLCNMRDVGKF